MLDVTIKRQEADPIHKRLHRKASEKLRRQIRKASDGWRSQCAKREIALRNDRRYYIVDRGDRSHGRRRIDDDRSGEDRRSKRYRSERPARDGYRPRDNQPRERKSSAGRKKDGKGKGSPCEMHSYSGRPAKHEWAECSESPANQKKLAAKRAEAYYARQASPCE